VAINKYGEYLRAMMMSLPLIKGAPYLNLVNINDGKFIVLVHSA